jgi:putative methyltransferase (TIGR04325 family)
LMATRHMLARRLPALIGAAAVFTRGPDEPDVEAVPARELSAEGWREDPALDGWRSDFVTRARIISDYAKVQPAAVPLVRAQLKALGDDGRPVSVLELGGGLGRLAEACAGPGIDWHILEVSSVCDHGATLRPSVRFLDDAAAAFSRRYDLVIACGSLHYLRDWVASLQSLAAAAARSLMLLNVPVVEGTADYAVLERPREFGFRATMQSWLIARTALDSALAATGLAIVSNEPVRPAEPVIGVSAATLVSYVLSRMAGIR